MNFFRNNITYWKCSAVLNKSVKYSCQKLILAKILSNQGNHINKNFSYEKLNALDFAMTLRLIFELWYSDAEEYSKMHVSACLLLFLRWLRHC